MSAIGAAASRISLATVAGLAALSGGALAFGDARIPTLRSDQWDELNLAEILIIELVLAGSSNSNQTLQSRGLAYRYDEAAADRQLFEQRLGHLRTAGCHNDHVVGSMLGPTQRAVAMKNLDVRVSQIGQTFRCELGQLLVPFDGIDLVHHFSESTAAA